RFPRYLASETKIGKITAHRQAFTGSTRAFAALRPTASSTGMTIRSAIAALALLLCSFASVGQAAPAAADDEVQTMKRLAELLNGGADLDSSELEQLLLLQDLQRLGPDAAPSKQLAQQHGASSSIFRLKRRQWSREN
ncbi:hypothetical protein BOX15_Mlig013833g1, partial [Macrostomum lignano]